MKYVLGFFIFLFSGIVFAQDFLPQMDDVPLMPQLEAVEEVASFDHPTERMVIVVAKSQKTADEIRYFYREALRNLGWQEVRPDYYTRTKDSLSLEIQNTSSYRKVQFVLNQSNE